MRFTKMLLSILAVIFGLLIDFSNCVIILDSGNPARFIRGTFVDVNQPEFFGSSISEKQSNDFPVSESIHESIVSVIQNLGNFNEAMTKAMKKEVEKTDAASAVNTCRFARSRLTATRVQNTFQALLVKVAASSISESSNNQFGISESDVLEAVAEFNQMKDDLRQYDEATHGKEAITNFKKALQNFDSLELALSEADELESDN